MRKSKLTTTIGILVAALISATLGLYGWLFVRSMLRQPEWEHLIVLLFLWQTQTSAAFAIAAALIGAGVVLHQTGTAQQLEETRRARRAGALRAVLPLALSELCDYAVRCAEIHAGLFAYSNGSPVTALRFPQLPAGLVPQLTELIEASDPDHARPLTILVRRVQIHHARAQDTKQRASGSHQGSILVRANMVDRVIDAAEIYARCEALFVYARGEADAPAATTSPDSVKKALLLMLPSLREMDEVKQRIDRKAFDQ